MQLGMGDRVVLEARVQAMTLGVHMRPDIVEWHVEADVPVKVAILRVAGVAVLGAPHLLG